MAISLESLGIERLSVRERLELIDQIWDSLPESLQPEEVPEWHLVELARRRADVAARPGEGRPWREVLESQGCHPKLLIEHATRPLCQPMP